MTGFQTSLQHLYKMFQLHWDGQRLERLLRDVTDYGPGVMIGNYVLTRLNGLVLILVMVPAHMDVDIHTAIMIHEHKL